MHAQEEFGADKVGLLTGDISINPDAMCLIMTTEILRMMLYRGSEIMREVAWVIYDEVHYMRDRERGVVWEESIILLSPKVRFVFLSATIPNSREFVGWIAKQQHQPCHVVYTDYRPTPLVHWIFPMNGDGLHLVMDDKRTFREDNFQKAMAQLSKAEYDELNTEKAARSRGTDLKKKKDAIQQLVELVMEQRYDPVIFFAFSKRDCETYATGLKDQELLTHEEQEVLQHVFNSAIDCLSDEDKNLPQVRNLLPILKRGIGFHHGGLLPILKEVIEILFQEGLVKVLFATETFSIGLNMPARTVVFTDTRKWDGKQDRYLTSGEYIQMSGRAGRRGKDVNGIVIQMLDEKMDPNAAKAMLCGDPDPLYSSYHVGYGMLLNMMRVEGADPEHMLRSSFRQFQREQAAPAVKAQADELDQQRAEITVSDEDLVADYHAIRRQLDRAESELGALKMTPTNCIPYLMGGRLVQVQDGEKEFGWGAVVNYVGQRSKGAAAQRTPVEVHVAVRCLSSEKEAIPCPEDQPGKAQMRVVSFPFACLRDISSARIFLPKNLDDPKERNSISKTIAEIKKRLPRIPSLHPVTDMKLKDPQVAELAGRCDALQQRMEGHKFHRQADRDEQLGLYSHKVDLGEQAKALRRECKATQAVIFKDDLRRMKRVLRKLGHTNTENVIETKGRVACEFNAADELLVTELMYTGVFNDLSVPQIGGLLSCLVFTQPQKDDKQAKLPKDLEAPLRQLQDTARKVANICVEAKIELDPDEYVRSFNPELCMVAYEWCAGRKFVDVMNWTEEFEGNVIRVIRRLDELVRQLGDAAKHIANKELMDKFEQCSTAMRRDIVFAASLYL